MGRALLVSCILLWAVPAPAAAFELGVFDPEAGLPVAELGTSTLQLARSSGAARVRVSVSWPRVAPAKPGRPTDPADPGYRWASTDSAVNEARQLGMSVLLSVSAAPTWAEEPGREPTAVPGSWKPRPDDLADFTTALATRYRDVRAFQIWNEPNLSTYLAPQWILQAGGDYEPFAALRYREMLNAGYAAINAVDPANRLVTAGTGPFGDPLPGGNRTMPVRFWREVMCLDAELRPQTCAAPPHFDILAHHPYGTAGPRQTALNPDDATVPDMGKLSRVLRAARKHGTVLPATRKPLWVTELSWDSSPPDPDGVPERRHAAWLADALYTLWRQHVESVLWFRVIDQAPVPSFAATNQSGLLLRDGTPKLAARAYAFPLSCRRAGRRRVRVWGSAPAASAPVSVMAWTGSGWRTLASLRAGEDRVFTGRLDTAAKRLRSIQGNDVSLTCAAGR